MGAIELSLREELFRSMPPLPACRRWFTARDIHHLSSDLLSRRLLLRARLLTLRRRDISPKKERNAC